MSSPPVSQPPFVPSDPLREDPEVLSSTITTVGGVEVIYQRGTNQAHRLVVGASTGEWYPPLRLATLEADDVLYAALSEVEYERNGGRVPRVFIASEEETMVIEHEWTTGSLIAGASEEHIIPASVFGKDRVFIVDLTIIRVAGGPTNDVKMRAMFESLGLLGEYLLGADPVTLSVLGLRDGPVIEDSVETFIRVGKPIRNKTNDQRQFIRLDNVIGSDTATFRVILHGIPIANNPT